MCAPMGSQPVWTGATMTTIRNRNNQWSPVHCSVPRIVRFPAMGSRMRPPAPLRDIPSGCGFFPGPWTVTRSSLCMLRRGCVLLAAAGARAGVVSAFAVRSGWCAGAVLVAVGASCALAVPVIGVPQLCWLSRGRLTVFAAHAPRCAQCAQS